MAMPAFAQQPCNKVVSFGFMAPTQGSRLIHYNPPDGTSKGWLNNWVRMDAKNYPDVFFLPNPLKDRANSLAVWSGSPRLFQGFQAVTSTTTHTTPGSGSGTFTHNYGGMWNFSYNSEVTTTTTHENFPCEIKTNSLYARAYNGDGALVSQRYHFDSTQTLGDPYAVFSYNVENLFRIINARGRLITSTLQHIAGPAPKEAKSD